MIIKLLLAILLLPTLATAQMNRGYQFVDNTATIEYRYQVLDSAGRVLVDARILKNQRTGEAWVVDGQEMSYFDKHYFKKYRRKLLKRKGGIL